MKVPNLFERPLSGKSPGDFPSSLRDWMETYGSSSSPASAEESSRLGVEALRFVLRHPGRHRKAAFALLAADAFLTLACGQAVETDDPEEAILSILDEVTGLEAE